MPSEDAPRAGLCPLPDDETRIRPFALRRTSDRAEGPSTGRGGRAAGSGHDPRCGNAPVVWMTGACAGSSSRTRRRPRSRADAGGRDERGVPPGSPRRACPCRCEKTGRAGPARHPAMYRGMTALPAKRRQGRCRRSPGDGGERLDGTPAGARPPPQRRGITFPVARVEEVPSTGGSRTDALGRSRDPMDAAVGSPRRRRRLPACTCRSVIPVSIALLRYRS